MRFLIEHLSAPLLAALLLGFGFGVASLPRTGAGAPRRRRSLLAAALLGLVLLAGAALAASGAVPGRPGFWLEAGVLLLGAFAAGLLAAGAAGAGWALLRRGRPA